jgi:hypothetical protein
MARDQRHTWRDNPCAGTGSAPAKIHQEPRQWPLRGGGTASTPGRGDCPVCGARKAFRDGKMLAHKNAADRTKTGTDYRRVLVQILEETGRPYDHRARVRKIRELALTALGRVD